MLFSRTRTALTRKARQYREWRDWDIVLEIEQREGDPLPCLRMSGVNNRYIDWGNGCVTSAPGAASSADHRPEYCEPGVYTVKVRFDHYSGSSHVWPGVVNTGQSYTAQMPQLRRVLKCDCTNLRSMSDFARKCTRLESMCKITHAGKLTSMRGAFCYCFSLHGTLAVDSLDSCVYLDTSWNYANIDTFYCPGGMDKISSMNELLASSGVRRLVLGDMPGLSTLDNFALRNACLDELEIGDCPSLTTMAGAFQYSRVRRVKIGDCPSLGTMSSAFANCGMLEEFEIGETPAVETMSSAFHGCGRLRSARFASGRLDACESFNKAFYRCVNLETSVVGLVNPAGVEDLTSAFYCCYKMEIGDVAWQSLPVCTAMSEAFGGCLGLTGIDIGDAPLVPDMSTTFNGCHDLRHASIGDLAACTTLYMCFQYCANLVSVRIGRTPVLANIGYMFGNNNGFSCYALEEVEMHADEGTLNNTTTAFYGCISLRHVRGELRLRASGPSGVSGYNNMFYNCISMEEIPDMWPVGGFADTFAVAAAQFSSVFQGCFNLRCAAPSWLWDANDPRRYKGTGSKNNCFVICYNLSNYNDIPAAWGRSQQF